MLIVLKYVDDESWLRTDSDSMIDMMDETGQNTYVAHISGGIGSCEWLSLVDLLESAGNSEAKEYLVGFERFFECLILH